MEEQLISFETAKLAKEKGFCEFYNALYYDKDGNEWIGFSSSTKDYEDKYVRSSQSLLQKWLREKHNISVIVLLDDTLSYYWHVIPLSLDCVIQKQSISLHVFCDKYESALEDGLKFALTEMEL